MKNKILGYVLSTLGLGGLLLSSGIGQQLPITQNIPSNFILIAGIALVVVGVIIISASSGKEKQEEEVPIYKGQKIVGYRRH
jgi:hypothetical protein